MSRCAACDKKLSDYEATRKYYGTQKYVDLCNGCFSTIKDVVVVTDRSDLLKEQDKVYEPIN